MSRFILLVHCVLIFFFSSCTLSLNLPIAQKGVLDLRNYNFEKNGSVKLNGEWELYWEEFLLKQEEFQQKEPIFVKIPKVWSKYEIEREKNNFFNYATFRLKILLPPNVTELWIRSRAIFNSNNIYANGCRFLALEK